MLDYKHKYKELKLTMMEVSDAAYKLGYEKGYSDAQIESMQAQMQQAQAMAAQVQAQQGQEQAAPGQDNQDPGLQAEQSQEQGRAMEQEQAPAAQYVDEDDAQELDTYINELENLVAKGEKPKVTDLRNVVLQLADLRKSQREKTRKEDKIVTAQRNFVKSLIQKMEGQKIETTEDLAQSIVEKGIKLK